MDINWIMYALMGALNASPIVFKGAMVLREALAENGLDVLRPTPL